MARVREFNTETALDAAMTVFRRRGFAGASIQELVEETGVGRGSLYAAFDNKEGLYLAALDRYQELQVNSLIEALRRDAPAPVLLHDMLVGLVDQIVADNGQLSCLMISASVERCAHDEQVAGRVRLAIDALEDALTELITTGQRLGQLSRARPPRDLARFLHITMRGLRSIGTVSPDRDALLRTAEVALRCLD